MPYLKPTPELPLWGRGAGGPGWGQPHGSGEAGVCVGSGVLALHPLGNGCKVLNSCKLGMSHVVGGPHIPWAKPGSRMGVEPQSLLGHLCSLPW